MSKSWKVTDAVDSFQNWLDDQGVYDWGDTGIKVGNDVKACIEGLVAIGAGGVITVIRDTNGRLQKIYFGSFNVSTYDAGTALLDAAISSHDDIDEGAGYTP
jgi:hypothetical protein